MRDVKNTTAPYFYLQQTYAGVCQGKQGQAGPIGAINKVSVGTRTTFRSQRSDSFPTTPSDFGKYFAITDYSAFFATISGFPGSVQTGPVSNNCLSLINPRITWIEKRWEAWSDFGFHKVGCKATSLEPDIPLSVIADARSKIVDQIRNNDLNAGQFLGELKETVGTITSLASDGVKLLRSLRHPIQSLRSLSISEIRKKTPNRASSEFLRYMYGIRPIMMDIHAAASNLTEGVFQFPIGHAYAEAYDPSFSPSNYPSSALPANANVHHLSGVWKRGLETACYYKIDNPTLYQLDRYGVVNLASLAWELTTLSFVVDWFTGIGNFLDSLTAGLALSYQSGFETHFLKIDGATYSDMVGSQTLIKGDRYASAKINTTSMRRYVGNGILPPPVYFEVDLNLNRVLASVALLTSLTSGGKPPRGR